MPQIEFDGQGEPIPIYAIPPFQSESSIPPTVLTFTNSADFLAQTYRDLGYTHFEAWCIGAAGGRGGGVQVGDTTDPSYIYGEIPSTSYGGEGGGGGLHTIGGLLVDLPPIVQVVVGSEGVAGADGNRQYRWRVAVAMQYEPSYGYPMMLAVVKGATNVPYMTDASGNAIPPYFYTTEEAAYLFFENPNYVEPQDGTDGGYSSFNSPLGLASGGRGGKKSPVYRNNQDDKDRVSIAMQHAPGGEGGQGGIGGRIDPGGGGDGGKASELGFFDVPPYPFGQYRQEKPRVLTPAKDGFWDGVVGQGGGGGRGGTSQSNPSSPITGGATPPTVSPSSSGGKGSFSYADTSVYGPPGTVGTLAITPGTAGGARVLKNQKFGSRSSGYNPNGVVVVRLTRIV